MREPRYVRAEHSGGRPIEVSLVELVLVLSEMTEDENEIFATVDHMVERGSVKLSPWLEARMPEAY